MYIDADTAVRLATEQIEMTLREAAQWREVRAGQPARSVGGPFRMVLAWLGCWVIS